MFYKIVAKRWFQRSVGNTYHSVECSKCIGEGIHYKEEFIGRVPFAYGYGEQYLETALSIFIKAGIYDRDTFYKDIREHRELWCITVLDVKNKRDL